MSSSGGAWPASKIPAKSSPTRMLDTMARRLASARCFPARMPDSAKRVLQTGSGVPRLRSRGQNHSPQRQRPQRKEPEAIRDRSSWTERWATRWNDAAQRKVLFMTFTQRILTLACLVSTAFVSSDAKLAQGAKATQGAEAKVTPLLTKELTNLPGKEGLMITVEYP